MTDRLANTISGGFLLAVALLTIVAARALQVSASDKYTSASFMPTLLGICLGACAIAIIAQAQKLPSSRRMAGWSGADIHGALMIGVFLAATAAYNVALEPIGYIITTTAYLAFLFWYLKVNWRWNIVLTVLCTIGTYVLFVGWLKVDLPMGLLEIYI